MMAGIFFLFVVALLFIWAGMRVAAMFVIVINLLLCLMIFYHHMTSKLHILL